MITENEFNPERLNRLAERLLIVDVKPRVKIIDESSELFLVDNQIVGNVPIFFGPISQLPRIFKREWSFEDGEYYWVEDKFKRTITSLQEFFGIGLGMLGHVFIPGAQLLRLYGGRMLTSNAQSKDIAYNIHQLILSQNLAMNLLKEINIFISKN